PEVIDAGLSVVQLGRSSVVYGIGLFRSDDDDAAATGRFVHVWVDRVTRRPVRVPEAIRAALAPLVVSGQATP
ncbi:MAG: acyl-CoA thioesterase, partial [Casimicrobiaceae bacterium]